MSMTTRLLMVARYKEPKSVFFRDNLPLDLFKIFYKRQRNRELFHKWKRDEYDESILKKIINIGQDDELIMFKRRIFEGMNERFFFDSLSKFNDKDKKRLTKMWAVSCIKSTSDVNYFLKHVPLFILNHREFMLSFLYEIMQHTVIRSSINRLTFILCRIANDTSLFYDVSFMHDLLKREVEYFEWARQMIPDIVHDKQLFFELSKVHKEKYIIELFYCELKLNFDYCYKTLNDGNFIQDLPRFDRGERLKLAQLVIEGKSQGGNEGCNCDHLIVNKDDAMLHLTECDKNNTNAQHVLISSDLLKDPEIQALNMRLHPGKQSNVKMSKEILLMLIKMDAFAGEIEIIKEFLTDKDVFLELLDKPWAGDSMIEVAIHYGIKVEDIFLMCCECPEKIPRKRCFIINDPSKIKLDMDVIEKNPELLSFMGPKFLTNEAIIKQLAKLCLYPHDYSHMCKEDSHLGRQLMEYSVMNHYTALIDIPKNLMTEEFLHFAAFERFSQKQKQKRIQIKQN